MAIAVERSLEMIIGLLGILKAGGAYVPLDPDYPTERLRFMLEDTSAPVLITQLQTQEKLKSTLLSYKGQVVFIDQAETKQSHIYHSALPSRLCYLYLRFYR